MGLWQLDGMKWWIRAGECKKKGEGGHTVRGPPCCMGDTPNKPAMHGQETLIQVSAKAVMGLKLLACLGHDDDGLP